MNPTDLVLAVRAYIVRQDRRASVPRTTAAPENGWRRSVLVLDTETTVDATQELLFGSYRYCAWTDTGSLACVHEGLFYADTVAKRDSAGLRLLRRYAATHHASVGPEGDHRLHLLTRGAFVDDVLWPALKAGALIVGFNLPFDLSRLATLCGEGRSRYRGGFSFRLWGFGRGEHLYRPRLGIKHVDSKRSFMGVLRPARDDPANALARRAHFLDLRTLAFALTDESYALDQACRDFGVEDGKLRTPTHGQITPAYIDYNRRDVLASSELLVQLRAEFDRHPIELDPCKAFSPASIAKAYLRQMSIAPPRQQFCTLPPRLLGRAMSAYFGGRAECRIRNAVVPVVYLDFLSMYPTVNTLLGLWRMLTAESLHVTDATREVQQLLAGVTVERCLNPATWSQLTFFAEVQPEGDVLPARARYTEGTDDFNIGINPLTSSTSLWYPGPDLVAAALLTGKAPKVLRAFRLVPEGQQPGLQPVRLRGEVVIDPRHDDFFKRVIEERQGLQRRQGAKRDAWLDLFLKVLANAGSYGIFAEMNRNELAAKRRCDITIYGLGKAGHWRTHAPEELGPYCFPPLAALITAGARLMLALLERCVTDQGGTYTFCDTDSMAVVATERGGLAPCPGGPELLPHCTPAVRALAWHEVEAIVARFAALNPYDRNVVSSSVLKIEDENLDHGQRRPLFAYVISAKRYALFTQDGDEQVTIVKPSEHGLGHLLNPADPDDPSRDWITAVWAFIVKRALGFACEEPPWLDQPAIGRVTISSPQLLRPFAPKGKRRTYARAVKPMNFLLSAHVARFGHPAGADPQHFHLMAPYANDPRQWLKILWADIHSGQRYAITTTCASSGRVVRVKSYRDVLAEYEVHPEPKSAGDDGAPCGPGTRGLLRRRAVRVAKIVHIGKEANRLEDVEAGWIHDVHEVVEVYEPRA